MESKTEHRKLKTQAGPGHLIAKRVTHTESMTASGIVLVRDEPELVTFEVWNCGPPKDRNLGTTRPYPPGVRVVASRFNTRTIKTEAGDMFLIAHDQVVATEDPSEA